MRRVNTEQLRPGMIIAEDIYAPNGQLIIAKGTKLTDATLEQLSRNAVLSSRIDDSVKTAAASSQKREEDIYKGDDIPGFTSNLPENLREARAKQIKEQKKSYTEGLNFFQISINNLVVKNTDMDVDTIIDQTLALLGSNGKGTNILQMLVFMQEYDSDVYAHSVNVSLLCNMLAHWLGYSEEDCRLAAACGMFHDIGKLTIPEEILQKPGPLTPEEKELVNTHTEKGYQMLKDHPIHESIKLSALLHHENCDGTGYPYKLPGDQIDPYAKLVTICNIYDAMTSNRPYRKAISPFDVIDYFEKKGLQKFDTRSILLFLENTINTYLNCPVRLSNGMIGYVVFINRRKLGRPTVQCGTEFIDLAKREDLRIMELLPAI